MRLIWIIFFREDSVWASLFKEVVLKSSLQNYWTVKPNQSNSWLVNKLIKLRTEVYPLIKMRVENGRSARFWPDNWAPTSSITMSQVFPGGRLGIPLNAIIASLNREGSWRLPPARSVTVPKTLKTGVTVPAAITPAKEQQLEDLVSLQTQLGTEVITETTGPERGSTLQTVTPAATLSEYVEEPALPPTLKTINSKPSSPINTNKASTQTPNPPILNKLPSVPPMPNPLSYKPQLPEKTLVERLRKSEDKTLKKVAPVTTSDIGRPRVLIPDSVFEKGAEFYKDFIVCYFNGKPPPFSQIQSVFNHMWGKGKQLEIHNNPRNRATLVRIRSEYLREKIHDKCIWYVGDSMFHTVQWTSEHSMTTPPLKAIKIWAHLTGVPLDLRHQQGLSLVAGLVGEPKETDDFTKNLVSLTVSHVKVEVDLTIPLPSVVEFQRQSGEVVEVLVHYPWTPPTCSHCHELGHIVRNCLLYVPPSADPPPPNTSTQNAKATPNKSSRPTNPSSNKPPKKTLSVSKTPPPKPAQTYVKKLQTHTSLPFAPDPNDTSSSTPNLSNSNQLTLSLNQMDVHCPISLVHQNLSLSNNLASPDPPPQPSLKRSRSSPTFSPSTTQNQNPNPFVQEKNDPVLSLSFLSNPSSKKFITPSANPFQPLSSTSLLLLDSHVSNGDHSLPPQ
ncbi:hypothetical protein F2Q68_00027690 [Brassica cretica]|uniref:DUF4283 domain-containing protein n=1 Tax=Brassica cretica TaxID=69181 RepID=A0A8S9IDT0_BRACR|nr:hypothetical protein F2Q68_00027690 [Brassica cretica]